MSTRREFGKFILVGIGGFVGACSTSTRPAIVAALPPEVQTIVADAEKVVTKGRQFLSNNPSAMNLIVQAENHIGSLQSGSVNVKQVLAVLLPILGAIGVLLPPPYNLAAGVVVAIGNAYVSGKVPTIGQIGMTVEQARTLLAK